MQGAGERKLNTWLRVVLNGGKVACFGSRETPPAALTLMRDLGRVMASLGARMASGHAAGADWSFEQGACAVRPESFTVCLPWRTYNAREQDKMPINPQCPVVVLAELPLAQRLCYQEEAARWHPRWAGLSRAVRLLHGRNILIGEDAGWGFCYLSDKPGGGGSGQCFRYLTGHGIPVVDLRLPSEYEYWRKTVDAFLPAA